MSLPEDYRDYFIRNLHDALSGHSSNDVAEAVKYSEKSKTKCIGITIETRPDYCLKRHLSDMLLYGCTRCLICKTDFKFFSQNFYSYLYYGYSFRFIPKITKFEKKRFAPFKETKIIVCNYCLANIMFRINNTPMLIWDIFAN